MGIGIDPGDPINGGIPTCLDYMPPKIDVEATTDFPTTFTGTLTEDPGQPGKYGGPVTSPDLGTQPCLVTFGISGTTKVFGQISILNYRQDVGTHCNLPTETGNVPGYLMSIEANWS